LLATAKSALVTTLAKLRDRFWRFVGVTILAALVLPTGTVTGALPVPVRLTVWGLFGALSVNVSVPVAAPVAVGEKVTPTVQLTKLPCRHFQEADCKANERSSTVPCDRMI
jgi:hypothetical protein